MYSAIATISTPDRRVIIAWFRSNDRPRAVAVRPRRTNTRVNPAMKSPVCRAIRGRCFRSPSFTSATSSPVITDR
jgi:hypothetical protein